MSLHFGSVLFLPASSRLPWQWRAGTAGLTSVPGGNLSARSLSGLHSGWAEIVIIHIQHGITVHSLYQTPHYNTDSDKI